jgi:hypothetical protein
MTAGWPWLILIIVSEIVLLISLERLAYRYAS